jgi:hypothetical protein
MTVGSIYMIKNNINNKVYIGKTTASFEQRYHGKWWQNTHNKHLKKSAKKHGHENFTVSILKEFDNIEDLNKAEIDFIIEYKSLDSLFGYNKSIENPDYWCSDETFLAWKEKQSEKMKEIHKGEDFKIRRSKSLKDAWERQNWKEQLDAGRIKYHADPVNQKKHSESCKKAWESEERKANHRIFLQKRDTPEQKNISRIRRLEWLSNPENKQIAVNNMEKGRDKVIAHAKSMCNARNRDPEQQKMMQIRAKAVRQENKRLKTEGLLKMTYAEGQVFLISQGIKEAPNQVA